MSAQQKQVTKLAAALVEFSGEFGQMSIEDRQWAIKNTKTAIGLFADAVKNRSGAVPDVIDCDADPYVPDGWKVEEHQKGGQFKWDASQMQLFLAEGQKNGKRIEGNKLRKELASQPVLNANVLDYMLAHPHLIPEE